MVQSGVSTKAKAAPPSPTAARPAASDSLADPLASSAQAVQFDGLTAAQLDGDGVQSAAAAATAGPGGALPHRDRIQAAFGGVDISSVKAHTGGRASAANEAFGSKAFATGESVAFSSAAPDLHTAAHEAAHVVQQQKGVQLKGGVGAIGDAYERHADAVADAVVSGQSAEGLLTQTPGGGGGGEGVQFEFEKRAGYSPHGQSTQGTNHHVLSYETLDTAMKQYLDPIKADADIEDDTDEAAKTRAKRSMKEKFLPSKITRAHINNANLDNFSFPEDEALDVELTPEELGPIKAHPTDYDALLHAFYSWQGGNLFDGAITSMRAEPGDKTGFDQDIRYFAKPEGESGDHVSAENVDQMHGLYENLRNPEQAGKIGENLESLAAITKDKKPIITERDDWAEVSKAEVQPKDGIRAKNFGAKALKVPAKYKEAITGDAPDPVTAKIMDLASADPANKAAPPKAQQPKQNKAPRQRKAPKVVPSGSGGSSTDD